MFEGEDMPHLEYAGPNRVACVDVFDLNHILAEVADLRDGILEVRDKLKNDSNMLTKVDTNVDAIVNIVKQTMKDSVEQRDDLDFLFKKMNLHGGNTKYLDSGKLLEFIQTVAIVVVAIVLYHRFT